jgi:hypothetical protein
MTALLEEWSKTLLMAKVTVRCLLMAESLTMGTSLDGIFWLGPTYSMVKFPTSLQIAEFISQFLQKAEIQIAE